jgi:hypothetical protein
MSLAKKFRVDASRVKEGVWFTVGKNEDGTECRFRLRRIGRGNPVWARVYREVTEHVDAENLSVEEDAAISAEVFARANVVDWENVCFEEGGEYVPFSEKKAVEILCDPDWTELVKTLMVKANEIQAFQREKETKKEEEAKN